MCYNIFGPSGQFTFIHSAQVDKKYHSTLVLTLKESYISEYRSGVIESVILIDFTAKMCSLGLIVTFYLSSNSSEQVVSLGDMFSKRG